MWTLCPMYLCAPLSVTQCRSLSCQKSNHISWAPWVWNLSLRVSDLVAHHRALFLLHHREKDKIHPPNRRILKEIHPENRRERSLKFHIVLPTPWDGMAVVCWKSWRTWLRLISDYQSSMPQFLCLQNKDSELSLQDPFQASHPMNVEGLSNTNSEKKNERNVREGRNTVKIKSSISYILVET